MSQEWLFDCTCTLLTCHPSATPALRIPLPQQQHHQALDKCFPLLAAAAKRGRADTRRCPPAAPALAQT